MADKKVITPYDYLVNTITGYFDEMCKSKKFDENDVSIEGLTYHMAEQELGKRIDAAGKEINLKDFNDKIRQFKENAFFYLHDTTEGTQLAEIGGLESLESCYLDELTRVFGNGGY